MLVRSRPSGTSTSQFTRLSGCAAGLPRAHTSQPHQKRRGAITDGRADAERVPPAPPLGTSRRQSADYAIDTYDPVFTARFCQLFTVLLRRLFRWQVTGLEQLERARPGILAINHNAGCWGILDIVAVYCAFHFVLPPGPNVLYGMSVQRTFGLPIIGSIARRIGLRPPTPAALGECLRAGGWVLLAPGGDTDMRRPIWQRNRVRFKKSLFVGGRRVLRDNLWYLDAALAVGVPVYPVAISGTHEMTPILWESTRFFRWCGLHWLRADESWPGFSLTLNHLLNAALFATTSFAVSPIAWAIFLAVHIYCEFAYFYPLFPFQVKMHLCQPVTGEPYPAGGLAARQAAQHDANDQVVSRINSALERLDRERWWSVIARGVGKRRNERSR